MTERETYADFVDVRVFLEGVLFPYVKSIQITDTAETSKCRIEVPPSIKMNPEHWAGMTCHIFYATKRVVEKFGEDGVRSNWPILFQGELSGFNHNTSVQNERVTLKFESHVKHFDQTLLYFYNEGESNPMMSEDMSHFIGNNEIKIDMNGLVSRSSRIFDTLSNRTEELEDIEGYRNIAFTSMMLDILREARNRHISFSFFDDKFKLTQRFASFADPDVKKIINMEMVKELVDNRMRSFGEQTALTELMEVATDIMRYDWLHISQPKLRTYQTDETFDEELQEVRESEQIIDRFIYEVRAMENNEDVEQTIDLFNADGDIQLPNYYFENMENLPEDEFKAQIFAKTQTMDISDAIQEMIDDYKFPEDDVSGDVDQRSSIEKFDEEAQEDSEDAINLSMEDQARLLLRDEINEFAVVPNMEFAQPPKCNVMMPYFYRGSGMVRSHNSEPTRLYARVPLTFGNDDVVEWYMAPSSQSYYYVNEDGTSEFTKAYDSYYDSIDMVEFTDEEGEINE